MAILWLAGTGARRSEVLRATWGDLRLDPADRAQWTIPKPKNRIPSVRPIPLEVVMELKRLPRDGTLVIGHKWTDSRFSKAWCKLRSSAGLPEDIHLHDLRRTFGLVTFREGDLKTAQLLLGHAGIKTTADHYTPLDTDDVRGTQGRVAAKILSYPRDPDRA